MDLFKARQSIVQELQRLLGEFRDYNGGMIAKQHEQFIALKGLLSQIDKNEELLLENFFHSIFPIEHRCIFNPLFLKDLFLMFLEAVQKRDEEGSDAAIYQENSHSCCYFLISYDDNFLKEQVVGCVTAFQIPSSQLLSVSLEHLGVSYLGYIYFEENVEQRDRFLLNLASATETSIIDVP